MGWWRPILNTAIRFKKYLHNVSTNHVSPILVKTEPPLRYPLPCSLLLYLRGTRGTIPFTLRSLGEADAAVMEPFNQALKLEQRDFNLRDWGILLPNQMILGLFFNTQIRLASLSLPMNHRGLAFSCEFEWKAANGNTCSERFANLKFEIFQGSTGGGWKW